MNTTQPFRAAPAVIILLLLAALAFWTPLLTWPDRLQWTFVAAVILLVALLAAIGVVLGSGPAGIIIDSRKCMSLSKLQACAWTVLVLAALLVGAAFNLASLHLPVTSAINGDTALNIRIPPELLAAMGISATSMVGAPALLSLKAGQTPTDQAVGVAAAQLAPDGAPPPVGEAEVAAAAATVPNIGKLMTNTTTADADWTDMITGDEVGNFAIPDLGKIQQLLVTILLLTVYGVSIWKAFAKHSTIGALPPLDQSFIWLMGVSHAGYLAYKAAPHTN